MANVKTISITGRMPFGCTDHNISLGSKEDCESMIRILGRINLPIQGLRIEYDRETTVGDKTIIPFRISGTEGVSHRFVEHVLQVFSKCGCVMDEPKIIEL